MDAAMVKMGNTKLLGIEVYTKYLYPLQVAAVILLVAIVAAIALTLRRRKDSLAQNVSQQVRAKKSERLRIVQMPPTIETPSAAAAAAPAAAAIAPAGATGGKA
jgi:NADH-quinone oxidoreductase subunit J